MATHIVHTIEALDETDRNGVCANNEHEVDRAEWYSVGADTTWASLLVDKSLEFYNKRIMHSH